MELPVASPMPIRAMPAGGYRVGESRVPLEAFIHRYTTRGMTVPELQESLPTLGEELIRAVIAYYHEHQAEVDAYMAWAERESEELFRQQGPRAQELLRGRRSA